ncbi:MAG: tRNA pseudouridine(55) synthase TruB [Sulfuricella sp.]|nr:tRNA pseudouridine(55) synthase TruB [Sulfuricella sp.]
MAQFKRIKRHINGVLLLDKPYGISSNGALQQAKRMFQAAKAGHTGNLDPIATGMLPICFGEATKFSQFLLDANKTYRAVFKLGQTTVTGDSEGEITSTTPVDVSREQVELALQQFLGTILQVPPMYSALKFQGKALYTYARAGVEIERAAREVTIYSLTLDAFAGDELTVTVECSKGTYIRVLAEDLGKALGCGAYMLALRRTRIGDFEIGQALTLEQLEALDLEARDAQLLSSDCLLGRLPKIELDREGAFYFRQGQAIWLSKQVHSGVVAVYDEKHCLVGTGEIMDDGKVAPKRLVVESAA